MSKLAALKNKKGFTLIEIIVVLVILAILAAAAVPSMLGFVEEARGKAYIAEARVGLVAAQAVATQLTATGSTCTSATILASPTFRNMVKDVDPGQVASYDASTQKFSAVVESSGDVTGITYKATSGSKTYTIVISSTGTTVTAS